MQVIGNLKKCRLDAKLTQVETADAIGVSQGAISQWESGATIPSADKLPELAKIFGCSINDLFGISKQEK